MTDDRAPDAARDQAATHAPGTPAPAPRPKPDPDTVDLSQVGEVPEPAYDRGAALTGLSPRQVVGGFAFVAAVILWLARRRRRKG
jgi:hypothetical protein